jgi:hypothetical protein
VIQSKVLSPNDFTDLAELERCLHAIQHRYQQTTVTFDCRFTAPTSTGCPTGWTSTSTAPLRHDHHARTSIPQY